MTYGETQVLVVGAGPVGLTLACEMRRYGVDCRIIDADQGPTPVHESRALVIQARTLEVLDHWGLAPALIARGRPIRALNLYDRGRRLCRLELDFDHLATPYPFVLVLEQGQTERVLIDRLQELETEVQWQTALVDLRQDDGGVTATLRDRGGGDCEVRSDWLVGCDGVRSTVRDLLRLSYEGAPYETGILLADAEISWNLEQDADQILLVRGRPIVAIPLPAPHRWRLIDPTGEPRPDGPDSIVNRFQTLLREAGFPDAIIGRCLWVSSFRLHRRSTARGKMFCGRRRGPRSQPSRGAGDEQRCSGSHKPGMEARAGRLRQSAPDSPGFLRSGAASSGGRSSAGDRHCDKNCHAAKPSAAGHPQQGHTVAWAYAICPPTNHVDDVRARYRISKEQDR